MLKKLLLYSALAVVLLVVGLVVLVALQPGEYAVERSTNIAAPAGKIFPLVNDLATWDRWSPWMDLDPNAKTTLSEPSSGKGATIAWNGNDQVGEGTLTILESTPDERVVLEQEFVRPMPGKALMTFTLAPEGDHTRVAWSISGKNDFLGKAVCLVMDMESMLGGALEEGLAGMKTAAEQPAAAPDAAAQPME